MQVEGDKAILANYRRWKVHDKKGLSHYWDEIKIIEEYI
ncbi:hypothetical protein NT01CX_0117 [Clostridium novyi NT]|uniref:Uncharacterized protein n=1 Tax=Clostridium novyi (strain NT) TaxID=386415 RepID=A0Q1X4_CLONN|nr:hypothetical protein NT01CX_0117 [Clostridium novyi NT]